MHGKKNFSVGDIHTNIFFFACIVFVDRGGKFNENLRNIKCYSEFSENFHCLVEFVNSHYVDSHS